MPSFTNIAAYKFAPLTDIRDLRQRLLAHCREWELKGTILLSPEGINLFVAGPAEPIERLLGELRSIPGLGDLEVKYSESDHQPFRRMLVRLKKEIIAFGVEGISPGDYTSQRIAPKELKAWLDEGRPVTLLDTRNDYEVKLGTFKGALPAGIDHFRDFPQAVRQLPEEMKDQPIVMFCTGGIRCEKAGPFMEREGFRKIYQLHGGILKYFEDCGGDHYDGECFVFDQRVGVDPALAETDSGQCFVCQEPLTSEEQADPRYVPGKSCPHCHVSDAERLAMRIEERQAALERHVHPLPGSEPYENFRPFRIPGAFAGQPLIEFLTSAFDHISREEWLNLCGQGLVVDDARHTVTPERVVRPGERYFRVLPHTVEPPVSADVRILHEDEALIVVNKPAPLPMHPCGRFNRNTLQSFLAEIYAPSQPRPAHRLDANTTGLVVFTRTRHFAKLVQRQFEEGRVAKTYLARVQGHPTEDVFTCDLPLSDTPGDFGSRQLDEEKGIAARTDFRVLERRADGTALLEVTPRTGRTNQIRLHSAALGYPICGDPAYLAGGKLGTAMTLEVGDAPLCLHSKALEFVHPITNAVVRYEAPRPEWA